MNNFRNITRVRMFVIRNLGDLDDMRMRGKDEIIKKFDWKSISKKYSLLLLNLICKNIHNVTTH